MRRRLRGKSAAPSNLSGSIAAFRKTRGLSDGQGSAGRVPDLPVDTVTATSTDCPCGWRPPLLVNRSVKQARVRAHWRVCQGRLPPIQDAGQEALCSASALPMYEETFCTDVATGPRLVLSNGKQVLPLLQQPRRARPTWMCPSVAPMVKPCTNALSAGTRGPSVDSASHRAIPLVHGLW